MEVSKNELKCREPHLGRTETLSRNLVSLEGYTRTPAKDKKFVHILQNGLPPIWGEELIRPIGYEKYQCKYPRYTKHRTLRAEIPVGIFRKPASIRCGALFMIRFRVIFGLFAPPRISYELKLKKDLVRFCPVLYGYILKGMIFIA